MRCCFCNNLADSTEDTTLPGVPDYMKNVRTTVPHAPVHRGDGFVGDEGLLELLRGMFKDKVVAGAGIAVAVGLLILLIRC